MAKKLDPQDDPNPRIRTSQGMEVERVSPSDVYEAGNAVPADFDEARFYKFNATQFAFLEEYAKDLDERRAAKALGLSLATVTGWLGNTKFRAEMDVIHDIWMTNVRATAEHAQARHIKLLNKMEKDYDAFEDGTKAKMAGSLAKMSDTYLKATGAFTKDGGGPEGQVVINIDLGGDPKNNDKVVISGEKKD
jgi:hypothetical protein